MSDDAEAHWEINNAGVYDTACVDITLSSLPMAAVLYADEIHENESETMRAVEGMQLPLPVPPFFSLPPRPHPHLVRRYHSMLLAA